MSFSLTIFQKDLYNITREDLELFFSDWQEENAILEFKEGSTDLSQIHGEVAAFLNTEGGLLIIGAPREIEMPGKKGYKAAKGSLTPSKISDRDVIMRGIGTGIAPAPTNIKINQISIEGGSVYILEIPQSINPPHQVSDSGRYFIRLEREKKSAPHGIVEALFQKRQKPNLAIKTSSSIEIDNKIKIVVTLSNLSLTTAESTGMLLTVIGANYIESVNTIPDFKWELDIAYGNHFSPNDILVKGMAKQYIILVEISVEVFFLTIAIYCKDAELRSYHYIINKKAQIIDSIIEDEENGEQAILLTQKFNELNNAEYLKILSFSEGNNPTPIKDFDVFTLLERAMEISLPRSYIHFFFFTDGFSGKIGLNDIKIFSSHEILENDHSPIKSNNYLVIGKINNKHLISLRMSTVSGKKRFGILYDHRPKNKAFYFEEHDDTMYGLLKRLLENKIT